MLLLGLAALAPTGAAPPETATPTADRSPSERGRSVFTAGRTEGNSRRPSGTPDQAPAPSRNGAGAALKITEVAPGRLAEHASAAHFVMFPPARGAEHVSRGVPSLRTATPSERAPP